MLVFSLTLGLLQQQLAFDEDLELLVQLELELLLLEASESVYLPDFVAVALFVHATAQSPPLYGDVLLHGAVDYVETLLAASVNVLPQQHDDAQLLLCFEGLDL